MHVFFVFSFLLAAKNNDRSLPFLFRWTLGQDSLVEDGSALRNEVILSSFSEALSSPVTFL